MGRPATLKIDILADAKGVNKGVNEAEGSLSRLGKGAGKVGLAVGAGLAAGTVAVGAFAVSAVGAASTAEQSMGAVESVFGKAANAVKNFSQDSASRLGLSQNSYRELASVVGSQLQGMGFSLRESAFESDKLITVGADLAATFGGSVSDAVGAVGSLLRGERDPIEKYGVSITAADVAARLAAKGQSDLTGAALKSAQAQATLELLTTKTAGAQGAFGRESNTLAGQQERLKAQFENVKATLGAGLLPILTRTFSFIGTTVVPVAQRLARQLAAELGPAFRSVGQFVTTNVLPVLRTLGGFITGTIVPTITGLAARVLPGVRSAFESVGRALSSNRDSFAKLQGVLAAVGAVIRVLAPIVGTVLGAAFRTVGTVLSRVINIVATLIDKFTAVINKIREVGRAIANSPLGKIGGAIGGLFSAPLHGMGVNLLGPGPSYAPPGGLATASLGGAGGLNLLRSSPSGAGVVLVDRRQIDLSVHVDGALDTPAVARQIERILRDQAVRLGRVTALA